MEVRTGQAVINPTGLPCQMSQVLDMLQSNVSCSKYYVQQSEVIAVLSYSQ